MREKIGTLIYLLTSFMIVSIAVMFLQHISGIAFFKNEIIYLASPYFDFRGMAKSIVFIASYLASISLIWSCIFIRSNRLWVGTIVLLGIAVWIDLFIQISVSARGFTKFGYAIALVNAESYENMLVFSTEIARAFIYSLFFVSILMVLRKKIKIRIALHWLIFLMGSTFAIVYGAKQWVYYIKYPSYPAIVKIPIIIADYHLNKKEEKPRLLDESVQPNHNKEISENIIWVIDESIGGKYLSVNGFEKNTTPYLESIINSNMIANYGIVNSVANCSATSNLMIRIGLSSHTKHAETDYILTRNKLPTIYQYAKRAGYKTWLFDSQADEGQFQNYLTPHDMKSIDEYITLDTRTEDYERDRLLLDDIALALENNQGQKNFIVFVKDGAHWPYLWRYPAEKEIFRPVQGNIYEEKKVENKEKLINTYSNVVRYAVDEFFIEYMKKIDINKTVTFYTSDHGQNLLDEGANTTLTHCSIDIGMPVSQGEVPLLVIGKNAAQRFPVAKDRLYSQYQIFPTTLSMMGYGKDITSDYGNTLIIGQPLSEKRWFYFGLEGSRVPFYNDGIE